MRDIRIRVFVDVGGNRHDTAVTLPGKTLMVDVVGEAYKVLKQRFDSEAFKVTGVQLYPHWNKRNGEQR